MFGIGGGELVVIVLVILLVFGPSKIPELARAFGAAYREFNRVRRRIDNTLTELRQEIDLSLEDDPAPPLRPPEGQRVGHNAPSSLAAELDHGPVEPQLPVPEEDDYLKMATGSGGSPTRRDTTAAGPGAGVGDPGLPKAAADPSDYLGAQR